MKVMEGVQAEGTRRTTTIPAGEIGNDRAIVSTSETWISPDIGMTIYRRTVDPRKGESLFQLRNITRDNPSVATFAIPEGYKIIERAASSFHMMKI
jgi:hypothetical protein